MTTTIEDTMQEDEEQEFAGRIERLADAIMAMIDAAHLHNDGEAVCALISCIDGVVGSIECDACRSDLIAAAKRHFNDTVAAIKRRPATDETVPPQGHMH
jgi:hypothetical protein